MTFLEDLCLCTRNRWKLGDEGDASGSGSRIFHDVHALLTRQMAHSRKFELSNCFLVITSATFGRGTVFNIICLFVCLLAGSLKKL